MCTITIIKKRSHAVTKSLNYRGDLDAVSLSDSVHVLCFSNEKLCCTQKIKAAGELGASFIKLQRLRIKLQKKKESKAHLDWQQ